MTKFFLVKGSHNANKIIQKGTKAYAITDNGTFKIRENLHSNSFVVYPHLSLISKIFEFSDINYREVYNGLEFTNFNHLKLDDFTDFLTGDEIIKFCKKFYVFYDNTTVAKIEYKEIIKILKYMQSCGSKDEFNLYKVESKSNTELHQNTIIEDNLVQNSCLLNEKVRNWAYSIFKGDSTELGFFILLDNLHTLESFITEWKRQDLYEIDLKALLKFVENSYLDRSEQIKIKTFLSRLI